ncbi:hypothetical protein B4N89_20835 [Embleya scabrispora]|uniref:HTH cro/C1-type domain-containing protein n=1 Tax=Embleya scabrispora TaxID=159449 RepID=A0A1T3P1Q7_9ACTN|nr:helix-turn-helix transcriptional regulator [Embleya scabrispora]OPC83059.1 hypothetical protein B4N89_20835 [Embleya scabrispora]
MNTPRLYRLRDPGLLRTIMLNPGRGQEYSVRELAESVGCHHSTIGHLLTGERESCRADTAHRIAEAVGVALLVLFTPPASPSRDKTAHAEATCAA